jgi:hypothetical protein
MPVSVHVKSDSNESGRPCLIMSHIPTQSGGAWNEMTGEFTLILLPLQS